MTCWERSGFDQRLGSAACLSISASCGRSLSESKVLLKGADFYLQGGELLFEFIKHGFRSLSLEELRSAR